MSRTAYKFSAVIVSLLVTAALSACGTDKKEGNVGPADVARVADEASCRVCHSTTVDPLSGRNLVADFLASPHNTGTGSIADREGCQGCHGGGAQHNGVGPIPFPHPTDRCKVCHNGTVIEGEDVGVLGDATITSHHTGTYFPSAGGPDQCGTCHNPHFPLGHFVGGSCVACHAFQQDRNEFASYVNDNNGVRAITVEFTKWSHHVTGVTLNDAHCAACHLEGKPVDGAIVVNTDKHMRDAKVHLRNADNDTDFQWDPAAPNHTNMDNFCMSCHDADGATSADSVEIQAIIKAKGIAAPGKTASAKNPFGDTISNRYDKMQRPGVIDVSDQFNTSNNSHHGVKGPRYSGRTRTVGDPRVITAVNPDSFPGSKLGFALHSSATLFGVRSTIYDSDNLNQTYTPLANAGGEAAPRTGNATLGDDSTLHCGDCHTVGQWKVGSSVTSTDSKPAKPTSVAIGAHGSNNEYLLRNSIGTDQRHTQNAYLAGNTAQTVLNPFTGLPIPNGQFVNTNPNGPFLVCYNCHNYKDYGAVSLVSGAAGNGHAGEYDELGRCNGIGNTLPFNGYTTGTATDGTQFASRFEGPIAKFGATPAFAPGFPLVGTPPIGEQDPDFGDIFGIQCLNCHNSGVGNAYGGIHGSYNNSNTITATTKSPATGGYYIDGMGNTARVERFLPGLGNAMYVSGTLGGITGGTAATVTIPATTRGTIFPAYVLTYQTGGVSSDTNWEQKLSTPPLGTPGAGLGGSGQAIMAGAGCYTLGGATAATSALRAPSVTGDGGPATTLLGTWGGCDDHDASQGGADHGVAKKIVRPITY